MYSIEIHKNVPTITYTTNVLVEDFVSCQYYYEPQWWGVVMQLVHATGKTWFNVLNQHTIYIYILNVYPLKLPTQTHDNKWHFNTPLKSTLLPYYCKVHFCTIFFFQFFYLATLFFNLVAGNRYIFLCPFWNLVQ